MRTLRYVHAAGQSFLGSDFGPAQGDDVRVVNVSIPTYIATGQPQVRQFAYRLSSGRRADETTRCE